jgi:hypothetical protein
VELLGGSTNIPSILSPSAVTHLSKAGFRDSSFVMSALH